MNTIITLIALQMAFVIFGIIAITNTLLDIKQELRWVRTITMERKYGDDEEDEEDEND